MKINIAIAICLTLCTTTVGQDSIDELADIVAKLTVEEVPLAEARLAAAKQKLKTVKAGRITKGLTKPKFIGKGRQQKVWFGSREQKNEEVATQQKRYDDEKENLSKLNAGTKLVYPLLSGGVSSAGGQFRSWSAPGPRSAEPFFVEKIDDHTDLVVVLHSIWNRRTGLPSDHHTLFIVKDGEIQTEGRLNPQWVGCSTVFEIVEKTKYNGDVAEYRGKEAYLAKPIDPAKRKEIETKAAATIKKMK